MTEQRRISFSPPDITQAEIDEVVDTLKSGWITTGPKTKEFERELAAYTRADGVATFSSATAALECVLRALGVGPGDEVITSAYTYTASCSVICHVGATPVLCDVAPNSYEMNYSALGALISERTKAIIPVDLGGRMIDYQRLFEVLHEANDCWHPTSALQQAFDRVVVIADAAHSLGATFCGQPSGNVADFTAFSFHAVKNLTTSEGGALAWRAGDFDSQELYHNFMLMSLHGQTKDALSKNRAGAWEYDIAFPGWKCNMTDIQAALGLAQLRRYDSLLARRKELVERYEAGLADLPLHIMQHYCDAPRDTIPAENVGTALDAPATRNSTPADESLNFASSGHLMLVRLMGKSQAFRNALIEELAGAGVSSNVHYKPLPLLSAYQKLGFDIANFPHAQAQFENEITLPLHTLLSNEDLDYVVDAFHLAYATLEARGIC